MIKVSRQRALLCALLLVTCLPSAAIADNLIVPGVRIGPAALGMSAQQLYRVMGEPISTQSLSDGNYYNWNGLKVFVYPNGLVDNIITDSSEFATAQGVRVGDSALALQAKLGKPDRFVVVPLEERYFYHHIGLSVYVDRKDGRISAIKVYPRGSSNRF